MDPIPVAVSFTTLLLAQTYTVLLILAAMEEDPNLTNTNEAIVLTPERISQVLTSTATKHLLSVRVSRSGRVVSTHTSSGKKKRRKMRRFDWDRARKAIMSDFLGPQPLFDDRQFARFFRVSRHIVEEIILVAGNADPFFTQRSTLQGKMGICPKVKVLIALQVYAYGISPNAFTPYYQMSETTARSSFLKLAKILINDDDLRYKYLRDMLKSDAYNLENLHYSAHGVEGMLGSLDCMHLNWKNCPVAHQGQFQGKESMPTLVMEAVSDYNLRIWHYSLGWPGSLNDINIWDRSTLLQRFTNGYYAKELDFE